MDYKSKFLSHLRLEGVKYEDTGSNRVNIIYNCKNLDSIKVIVTFDEDGEGLVSLHSWSLGKANDSDFAALLIACNLLNTKYRWVKFYIDDDKDITMQIDGVVDYETVGSETLQLVRRMVSIGDESYPVLMRAKWGN